MSILGSISGSGSTNGLNFQEFKEAKWKVGFCPKFHEPIARIVEIENKKEVVSLLVKLSNGFHEHHKDEVGYLSSQLLKCSVVKGQLTLVWTIGGILRESKTYIQVISVLDILPLGSG